MHRENFTSNPNRSKRSYLLFAHILRDIGETKAASLSKEH